MSRLISDIYKAEEEKQRLNGTYKSKSDISKKGITIAIISGIILIAVIAVLLIKMQ